MSVELFAEVVYAALCEVGRSDLIFPAFTDEADGPHYLEFDEDDLEPDELTLVLRAEQIGREAVARANGEVATTPAAPGT